MTQDGLLVIDKPAGMTSFDVVRKVRKVANTRKVGHTGTLDPDATGVLAVAIGRCTKLSRFVTLDEKRYAFTMTFGSATDTDDASGELIRQAAWEHVTRAAFEQVLDTFTGAIEQVPPQYSAIKIKGKRAHALARAGEEVELQARTVQVWEWEITGFRLPQVDLEVRCGPGTYVRSLSRDIGEALDSAAHADKIRRLAVGPFSIDDAVALDELTPETFADALLSPLEMVQTLPRFRLDEQDIIRVGYGQPIHTSGPWADDEFIAGHNDDDQLVAILGCRRRSAEAVELWPKRVMMPAGEG